MTSQAFELISIDLVHNGNLLARVRILMPSGLIVACSVLRQKKGEDFFVAPIAERKPAGWSPIVDFATPEVRAAWQAQALACLEPYRAQLSAPPEPKETRNYDPNF